jgi:hypothetical protein
LLVTALGDQQQRINRPFFIQARVSVVQIVGVILKVMCFDNGLITMDKIISLIPDLMK